MFSLSPHLVLSLSPEAALPLSSPRSAPLLVERIKRLLDINIHVMSLFQCCDILCFILCLYLRKSTSFENSLHTFEIICLSHEQVENIRQLFRELCTFKLERGTTENLVEIRKKTNMSSVVIV